MFLRFDRRGRESTYVLLCRDLWNYAVARPLTSCCIVQMLALKDFWGGGRGCNIWHFVRLFLSVIWVSHVHSAPVRDYFMKPYQCPPSNWKLLYHSLFLSLSLSSFPDSLPTSSLAGLFIITMLTSFPQQLERRGTFSTHRLISSSVGQGLV